MFFKDGSLFYLYRKSHLGTFLDNSNKSNNLNRDKPSTSQRAPSKYSAKPGTAKEGADSDGEDDDRAVERSITPMKQIESARAQWRLEEEKKLEESWGSLHLFNTSHKGRISMDLESKQSIP